MPSARLVAAVAELGSLGHRALAHMRKRKVRYALVGFLFALFAAWMLMPAGKVTNDEQKFRQMLRAQAWGWRFRSAKKSLPSPVVRLLRIAHLEQSNFEKAQLQEEALLASGYLTKASITLTNLPLSATNEKACLAELQRRFHTSVQIDFLSYYVQSNEVMITCRSRDLPLVRSAIETP